MKKILVISLVTIGLVQLCGGALQAGSRKAEVLCGSGSSIDVGGKDAQNEATRELNEKIRQFLDDSHMYFAVSDPVLSVNIDGLTTHVVICVTAKTYN